MKNPSNQSGKGFTLIELLVAMAITTIIITILVSITSLSLDTWNRSRSEIRASRQGKAMIDSMTRDLESLVVRKGNNFEWLYAQFNPANAGPKGNKSPNAADLVFFTAATDRYNGNIGDTQPDSVSGEPGKDKGGDVSTVAYQLAYKDPIAGSTNDDFKTFVLYRKLINPDITFQKTLGIQFDSASPSGDTLLKEAQKAAADPSMAGPKVDEEANFICENVYQFSMTFHVEVTKTDKTLVTVPVQLGDGSKATKLFKILGSGLHIDNGVTGSTGITNDQIKGGRLTSAEVSLTVLTDFGLAQMRKRTFKNAAAKDEFIAQNSYQFSKLIPLPGG